MADKKYHVIIVSEDTEEIRRFSLGRRRLRSAVSLLLGLFMSLAVVAVLLFDDYFDMKRSVSPLRREYESVMKQNLKIRRELDDTCSRLREVTFSFMDWRRKTKESFDDLKDKIEHIAGLYGIAAAADTGGGVGGTRYEELSMMFDKGDTGVFNESYLALESGMKDISWFLTNEEKNIIKRQITARGLSFGWPVQDARLTSYYGKRWDPIDGSVYFHHGIDLGGRAGTPVYSAEEGTVTWSGMVREYGNLIIISHGRGVSTRYAHLSVRSVLTGSTVKKGDLIGFVGMTGRSTGPHLHFEARINGESINPLKILR